MNKDILNFTLGGKGNNYGRHRECPSSNRSVFMNLRLILMVHFMNHCFLSLEYFRIILESKNVYMVWLIAK